MKKMRSSHLPQAISHHCDVREILVILSICVCMLSGVSLSTFSQNSNLEGTWVIEKTMISKAIDSGPPVVKTYVSTDMVDSFVQGPEKLTFTADSVICLFRNNAIQRIGTYTFTDNNLQLEMPDMPYRFQCSFPEPGKIQLIYTIDYKNEGIHKKVVEVCTYTGSKQ